MSSVRPSMCVCMIVVLNRLMGLWFVTYFWPTWAAELVEWA